MTEDEARRKAEIYDHMKAVAECAGFDSLTDAITQEVHATAALRTIADFGDAGASKHLAETGSYGHFDEPSSVRIAREALATLGHRDG